MPTAVFTYYLGTYYLPRYPEYVQLVRGKLMNSGDTTAEGAESTCNIDDIQAPEFDEETSSRPL